MRQVFGVVGAVLLTMVLMAGVGVALDRLGEGSRVMSSYTALL